MIKGSCGIRICCTGNLLLSSLHVMLSKLFGFLHFVAMQNKMGTTKESKMADSVLMVGAIAQVD